MKLSVVILSKNEEAHIKKALNSVSFADEIVLIDNYSSDSTTSIAEKIDAKVYKKKFDGDFSQLRNLGLEKSRGEWVFFVDADEIVTPALQNEIKMIVKGKNNKNSAYYIKRRDFWWGKELKYGEVGKIRKIGLVRLVRKNSGKWEGLVHESFRTNGSIGKLYNFLDHYPHPTLSEFLASINFYSTLRAKELMKMQRRASISGILFMPLGKFITTYILKGGFMDGVQGFAYSFLMSFHSFLVRAKHYQYTKLR